MATAFGAVVAVDSYATIQGSVIALRDADQAQPDLNIRLGNGASLSCNFIHIATIPMKPWLMESKCQRAHWHICPIS